MAANFELPSTALTAPPAAQVGDYILVRRIGSGGMGDVWLGRHVVSGTLGAVKRLALRGRSFALLAGYFAREGRAVARLAHPHIVPLMAFGADYLVTAYIDGGNLARRLQTPMVPGDALRLARQLADALVHAHGRGVVHRDVKPSNVLLDARGNAYLADFGLAQLGDEDNEARRGGGTPWFMAPEQSRGEAVGPAADQYAFGRTLLEMLAGGRVALDRDAALAELPAALPDALRALLARATALAPADRYPSMADLAAALAAIDPGTVGAPRRLAPAVRDAQPFAWLAGAHTVREVGPDLVRADLRLRELAAAGLLPAADVTTLLARAGLAELGFAVWSSPGRLGVSADPTMLARASDVVILLHGFGHTREVWAGLAAAVCRDNAQAVVFAPDLHGFGESRFHGTPDHAQASMTGLARAIDGWRRLLGVATIPTALVGHSMAGLALLTIDDAAAGLHVSRIAITPSSAAHLPPLRRQFRRQAMLAATIGRVGPLRRAVVHRLAARLKPQRHLVPEAIALLAAQTAAMPGAVSARIARALCAEAPAVGGHRRVAVVVGVDDPLLPHAPLCRVLDQIGVEPAHVLHLPDGGHYPHVESAAHPEWSARNAVDLARLIDAMLVTAGESTTTGSDSPIAHGSTVPVLTTLPS